MNAASVVISIVPTTTHRRKVGFRPALEREHTNVGQQKTGARHGYPEHPPSGQTLLQRPEETR